MVIVRCVSLQKISMGGISGVLVGWCVGRTMDFTAYSSYHLSQICIFLFVDMGRGWGAVVEEHALGVKFGYRSTSWFEVNSLAGLCSLRFLVQL